MLAPRSSLAVLVAASAALAQQAPEAIDFNRDIRPILSDRCFACHGFDAKARKRDLRLDTRDGQHTAHEGRIPVVPGDPDASELIRRIESRDPKVMMPPPDSRRVLNDGERALLRRWIEAGAPFADHWAWTAPQTPPLPDVRDAGWARNPIDRFVLARLEGLGLSPSPEAEKETLIRRVTLDLTGLPPSPERIDAFLADPRPDAYERVVEELFGTPQHGERMAQMWLDAARYADTNGYHHDNIRTAWPYRDWVIGAFARDLPYDRFVIEQLAGDLLPEAGDQERIASGFCRMHNINDEGGAIDAEYRVEAVADRIETIATTFMGLTFTCARCHDHKYDPFTQDDYYSLYAYFDSVDERGVYPNDFEPARAYPARIAYAPPELATRIAANATAIAGVERELVAVEHAVAAELAAWETALRARRGVVWREARLSVASSTSGASVERLDDGSARLSGKPERDTITLDLDTDATGLRVLRLDALADPSFPDGRLGPAANGNAVITSIKATAIARGDASRTQAITFAWAWADHEQQNGDFDVLNAILGQGDGWALDGHRKEGSRTAMLVAQEPFGFEGGTRVVIEVACESRYSGHVAGRLRAELASASADLVAELPLITSDWWSAGPFTETDFATAWTNGHGPEAVMRIDRGQRFGKTPWEQRPDSDAKVIELRGERAAFYLGKELRTPIATKVPISLGSDDAIKVFLDGKEIFANEVMRGAAPDQEKLELELTPGEHLLVVKVVNNGGPAGFYGRIDRAPDAPEALRPFALVPPERRSDAIGKALVRAFGMRSPSFATLEAKRQELVAARKSLDDERVPVVVMKEIEKTSPTLVLTRGRYEMPDPNRPVTRRPPKAFGGALPAGEPDNRLGFARWLVRKEHPLTARVHVNRLWQMVFGIGLVATAENFGQQADAPSHPGLLDWLATELPARGWSQRAILRLIVTSATYRQAATTKPDAVAIDPGDRLLAYFPRRRLAGEFVRDLALSASGLLVPVIGGPSVRPYEPEGLWTEVSIGPSSNTSLFARDKGEALWRRSLYTFWKRTSPNPQMATFDAPTREYCVVRRATTNTPLQALVLWNDEQFVEAARALAQRVMRERTDDASRVERMFRLCTGRRPALRERELLDGLLAGYRARYAAAPNDAIALLTTGERGRDEALDPVQCAAFTLLASTLFALDETVVRD
ncbi:MAG: PSD1 domain-containing protein [Planctomycetes bacterium]|nr:PSD1 domain-containing protein [Planctomycetota bacterium]